MFFARCLGYDGGINGDVEWFEYSEKIFLCSKKDNFRLARVYMYMMPLW